MSRPTKRCDVCGSRLYWREDTGEFYCAKHNPPTEVGKQYYITKSVTKDMLAPTAERPVAPCPIDGSTKFWRDGSRLWHCAKHDMPISEQDVFEYLDLEQLDGSHEAGETGEKAMDWNKFDWNRIAKTIRHLYGTRTTAAEAREMFEEITEEAKDNAVATAKQMAESLVNKDVTVMDGSPGSAGRLVPLVRGMTGSVTVYKKETAPFSDDRGLDGRRKQKRAELNRDGYGRVIKERE